ncbi:hypothetical protein Pla175_45660 [Pirellulimonas nuda]|uniref:Uncharacterized protein n=1 Tax=Pirellulimonas nuda TaxID=2528009 RepID=A0A518DI37_9BACT|nr:hypothetical protein [Pirellulimonas nuda]QDU91146.1 hypothetical protein Pla175_45660 [Pirellulimonas nuda]
MRKGKISAALRTLHGRPVSVEPVAAPAPQMLRVDPPAASVLPAPAGRFAIACGLNEGFDLSHVARALEADWGGAAPARRMLVNLVDEDVDRAAPELAQSGWDIATLRSTAAAIDAGMLSLLAALRDDYALTAWCCRGPSDALFPLASRCELGLLFADDTTATPRLVREAAHWLRRATGRAPECVVLSRAARPAA